MAIGAYLGTYRGEDVSFDQLNYHYYAPYALIHWRIDINITPASPIHNYFNPLVYVPFYSLNQIVGPFLTSAALGILQGIAFWLVGWIAWNLMSKESLGVRVGLTLAAVVISAASPMTLSELGTSFSDLPTGILALVAFPILTGADVSGRGWLRRYAIVGCLMGLATGLKLTNGIFVVGAVAATLLCGPPWRQRLREAVIVGIGALGGFIIAGGYWCLILWKRFRNPIFPYYNTIFRSPDFPLTSKIDHRYLPSGFRDALLYPFRWCVGIVPLPEITFRDIRFGTLIGLGLVAVSVCVVRVLRRRAQGTTLEASCDRVSWDACGLWLLLFFVASFVIWIDVFAIQRYLIVLELLCGPIAIVSLGCLPWPRFRVLAAWAFALCAIWTLKVPDWGHIPWLPDRYGIRVPEKFSHGGTFFLSEAPITYIVPSFHRKDRFIGMIDFYQEDANVANNTFVRRINAVIANSGEPQLALIALTPLTHRFRAMLGSYGLALTGGCERMPGYTYTGILTICSLKRTDDKGPLAVTLDSGHLLTFDRFENGFSVLQGEWSHNWELPDVKAVAGRDYTPSLFFKVGQGFASKDVRVRINADIDGGDRRPASLNIIANGIQIGRMVDDAADNGGTVNVCVPASAVADDGRVTIAFAVDGKSSRPDQQAPSVIIRPRSLEAESAGPAGCAVSKPIQN